MDEKGKGRESESVKRRSVLRGKKGGWGDALLYFACAFGFRFRFRCRFRFKVRLLLSV